MAIGESVDADAQARHAGHLGDVDLEYLYPPVGFRTKPDLRPSGEVLAEVQKEVAQLRAEVAWLKRFVHKHVNCGCTDDFGNEVTP